MAGAGSREARGLVYFDRRLWALTDGVRGRIAFTVLVGLAAVAAGIARLALLGWLLARVLAGESLAALTPAARAHRLPPSSGAARWTTRGRWWRTARRRWCSSACGRLLYDHMAVLGPAHFVRDRTGEVMLSMVEGVQQLEVVLRPVSAPALRLRAHADPHLRVRGVPRPAGRAGVPDRRAGDAAGAGALARLDRKASLARNRAYGAFGAEFLDAMQGLATLKAFGQSGARASRCEERAPRALQEHDVGARRQHAGARHHRHRHRGRRRRGAGARRLARGRRRDVVAARC